MVECCAYDAKTRVRSSVDAYPYRDKSDSIFDRMLLIVKRFWFNIRTIFKIYFVHRVYSVYKVRIWAHGVMASISDSSSEDRGSIPLGLIVSSYLI